MKTTKNVLSVIALSATIALGGCGATGGLVNPFANGKLDVTSIQNAAVAACGFLPTAASVAAIISAATGGTGGIVLSTAEQAAAAICQAVLPIRQAGKLGAVQPTVGGVVVHGKFVR